MAKATAKKVSEGRPLHLVVGIGASAGGVHALRKLFAKLDAPSDMALIVVQHISEASETIAHEVLQSFSPMKVVEIKDGTRLRGGVVFHVPPHSNVTLKNGIFNLEHANKRSDQFSVIDTFFKSLAEDQSERAAGVLLSGDGSDGALGLKAIGDAGGMTLAQMPETAEFPSMPQSAVSTGAVDHVLLPEEMGQELLRYAVYLSKLFKDNTTTVVQEQIKSEVKEICAILHKATRHDFKHYKTSTLVRRIQRRMQVLQINSVTKYVTKLKTDLKEADSLFKELLINVTCFFRDPEAFEALKQDVLIKALKNRKPEQKYRVWVAGCSTGEEVYSIAILIREIVSTMTQPPEVQIIATDLDESALNQARRGSYSTSIAENVSAARLKKFFVKKGGRYHVTKELREIVLFSSHNLINDPAFSQLDLISCRNVLIYLGPHLQKKLIPVFHYALRAGGCLFLGSSESLATHKELFRTISTKYRIGQRKATSIRPASFATTLSQSYVSHTADSARNHDNDVHLISQRIVLDEFAPKYAVVNEDCQIVSVSGGIAQYLDPSEGTFQNNLMKLVKPSLRVGLRSAFSEAMKEKRKVTHQDSTLKLEHEFARIGITVQPMPQLGDESELFMVIFHYYGSLRTSKKVHKKNEDAAFADILVVEQLERELATVRADLDRSVQDLEASNEELKSSNEELLSMNEELQSANEELETSKEDVQSVNETLQRSNTDLENLLASTEIATLFLGDDFTIKSFTPKLETIYNITPVDVGRPIAHLTNLAKKMPAFPKPEKIAAAGSLIEQDVEMQDGRLILRRILPYKTSEGTFSGIVVTFIDVTHLRTAEQRYRQLADSMPLIVWTATAEGVVDYYNERWYEFTGFDHGVDISLQSIIAKEDVQRVREIWRKSIETGKIFEAEFRYWDRKREANVWFLGRAVPVKDSKNQIMKWYGTCFDINDRVLAEEQRRETEKRFQIMADTAPVMVWISGPNRLRTWFNKGWLEWTGRTMEQELGNGWSEGIHPEDFDRFMQIYIENFEAHKKFDIEYRLRSASGEYRWVSGRAVPRFTASGTFEGFIGGCMDIHDQKVFQQKIAENEARLEMTIRTSPTFMCLLTGPNYVFEQANRSYLQLVGHRDVLGKTLEQALPEVKEQGFIQLLDGVRKSGEPFVGIEVPVMLQRLPGGASEQRYLDFVYQPDKRIEGNVDRIFVHGVDVTEKVLSRKAIADSRAAIANERENFRNLFKQTPEMVCILEGPEHRFEFVNEAHVRALGFDATGQTVREAQPESVEVHVILDDVYRTGITAELSEIPVTLGDRLRYFNLTYAARRDANNQVNGVMILGTEITNEVLNRNELQLAKDDAERARQSAETANESKSRFLANMSHEIRTPLAAILGFSELLHGRTKDGDADAAVQLDRISRNATQLGRLIDELLDLSKIEAERFEIERADFDLLAACEDALSTVNVLAKQKHLKLNHHFNGKIVRYVNTDQVRLKQVLTNIIGNAVKFTEQGQVDVEFSQKESEGKNFLQVRVIDTGIGLSPDQQSKLFEPFAQADASVTRKYGGTGLGLVLSRRLARLLGGDLVIEQSALGKGSVFLITLEISPALSQVPAGAERARAANTMPSKAGLTGRNILVVDDSTDNQTIIRLFVSAVGGAVEIASNGVEAVEKMREKRYDAVLMDIQMPLMDGYQALKAANANGYRGPVIALTAHAMSEERERCLAAGFTTYMSKPIDRALLVQRLIEVIQDDAK